MRPGHLEREDLRPHPVEQRKTYQDEPGRDAEHPPESDGVGLPADEAEPAAEAMQRPAEQREGLACPRDPNQSWLVFSRAFHCPSPSSPALLILRCVDLRQAVREAASAQA